jgi:hypothetical protein
MHEATTGSQGDAMRRQAFLFTGPAINVSYKVAYRGTREADLCAMCPEQTVAAAS